MRRNVLMAGALALVLAVPAANAQDKPNFSGTWNRVTDPNAAPTGGRGGGRGGIGMTATITGVTPGGDTMSVDLTVGAGVATGLKTLTINTPTGTATFTFTVN